MKTILSVLLILSVLTYISCVSQPVIHGTKTYACVGNRCGDLCEYEGVKVFPGERFANDGKCRKLYCRDNFELYLT